MNRETWKKVIPYKISVLNVFLIFGCLLFILLSFPSCVENRMTLSKAKSVSISMNGKAFDPPPSRVDDILLILNQPSAEYEEIKKARALIQAEPLNTMNRSSLALFYLRPTEKPPGCGHLCASPFLGPLCCCRGWWLGIAARS
ncbi:MAG: hypothetical protein GY699_21140 [Desulfobacteraceae bacterium]|nr:hypothetical protein [Desulfobacteraceae bacterium]